MSETHGTILVVDHNEAGRSTTVRALHNAGFRVLEAATGKAALEALKTGPELVLLDLNLPDINGFEVCRRLVADAVTCRIAVLHVLSLRTDEADARLSLASGAEGYLNRPVDDAVLIATVNTLVRVRRLGRERDRLAADENLRLRRELDEALRLNEQRFRVALRGSPICLWNQDLDLRYTWVYNLLPGWESHVLVGRTDQEALPPADLPRLLAMKQRVLAGSTGVRGEIALHLGDAERFYDMSFEPLHDETGQVAGLAGAAVDVTDSRRLETKLREAQKLESIGVLAGGIAHDFNNLLTGILGNTSLALDLLPEDHPARRFLDSVVQGSEKAAMLTNQLLAYAGKGQFVLEVVDLSKLVEDILTLIQASIPKTVRLHLALRRELPPISGDVVQLQQLIMNLIINAGEAIGGAETGTIRINTGVQEVSPYYIQRNALAVANDVQPGTYAYIEVRDTGCGMDERIKARIFEPFFTTKFTGRGLGLAAVHGIVRSHRGTIELYSTPGKGTTFKLLFPAAAKAVPAPKAGNGHAVARGSGTVLVADDDQLIREMTRTVLERQGYDVLLAQDGQEALDLFDRYADQIVVVLLDAGMPEVKTAGVFQHIRARCPGLQVIVSSGYPESEVLPQLGGGAAPLFVQKPYTGRRIAELVGAALTLTSRPAE